MSAAGDISSSAFERTTVLLGSGSFSNVYKGFRKRDNTPVAIKIYNSKVIPSAAREECEICAHLMRLDIPGIVKFYDILLNVELAHFEVVMETLSGGELFDRIVQRGQFSEATAASTVFTLIEAISQVHRVGNVIHADIKPENIVYVTERDDSAFRIIDFGLSIHTSPENVAKGIAMKELVGTYGYMPPETYFNRIYSEKTDMWSFGVILYVLLSGSMPFDVDSPKFQKKLKVAQYYTMNCPMWSKISEDAKDLIKKLLVVDPGARLSSVQALAHPWFSKYNLVSSSMKTAGSSSTNSSSYSSSSNRLGEVDSTFDEEYIKRLKALTSKQKMRKVINSIIWTNKVQRCLLSKTLKNSMNSSEDSKNSDEDSKQNLKSEGFGDSNLVTRVSTKEIGPSHTSCAGGGERLSIAQVRDSANFVISNDGSSSSSATKTGERLQNSTINTIAEHDDSLVVSPALTKSPSNRAGIVNSGRLGDLHKHDEHKSPSREGSVNTGVANLVTVKSFSSFENSNHLVPSSSSSYSFIAERQAIHTQEMIVLGVEDLYRFKTTFERLIDDPGKSCVNFNQFCQACDFVGLHCLAGANIFDIFNHQKGETIEFREVLVALAAFQEVNERSLRLYFDLFDKNGDGTLSVDEFKYVVGSCLSFTSTANMDYYYAPDSTDEEAGELDFSKQLQVSMSPPTKSKAFKFQDKLNVDIESTPSSGAYRDIFSVFTEMDSNKDGFISYEEFSRWMMLNYESVCHNFRLNAKISA